MSDKLKVDTRVTVETPEGVDFQFVIAGPGKRGVSFFLDTVIKLAVIVVTGLLVSFYSGWTGAMSGVGVGALLLTWFAMSWLYGSCFEAFWHGQTPGKKAYNLRVVRTNGTPIGWFEAFGRNMLLVADGMLVLGPIALNTVGLLSMASTKKMQRLGDLVFDTMVIDETRDFISRAAGITHNVEPLPRNECNGRYQVPERTLAVIERLFEGDRLISDGRREEIARSLSDVLRQRLGYEEPGPDAANPNTYFTQTAQKHTVFLKRVLKTFSAETDSPSASGDGAGRTRSVQPPTKALNVGGPVTELVGSDQPQSAATDEDNVDSVWDDLAVAEEVAPDESEFAPDEDAHGGLPTDWRTPS